MALKIIKLTIIMVLFLIYCDQDSRVDSGVEPVKEKIILKVAHNGNEKHPLHAGFQEFKKVLEDETRGVVEVQIFPNEQLGPEEETSQMVKMGLLSASASSTAGGLASFVSEAELFNLPFIFQDLEHFYRVLDGPPGQKVARIIEKKLNCVVLGYWFSGIRNLWNSKRPVLTPQDLEGLKIRVMSSSTLIETFNTLGAQATPLAFGELYSALHMGVVDGAETDHIDLWDMSFYEVTKYVSYTNHMFLAIVFIFSKKQFDRLPPDIQKAVIKAGLASVKAEREAMETVTVSAFNKLKEFSKLQFFEVDKKPFQEKVKSVYKNNAKRVGGIHLIEEVINQ